MQKYRMLILSNAVAGREKEFADWYDTVHLEDVLKTHGFVSAQRFSVVNAEGLPKAPMPYQSLAMYEIETDDISKSVGDLMNRDRTGDLPISDCFDRQTAFALMVTPVGPRIVK